MTFHPLTPQVGNPAWVQERESLPLPDGLPNHSCVTINAVEGLRIWVADTRGHQWELHHWQVDSGFQLRGHSGGWMRESQPEAIDAVERELRRLLNQPPLPGTRSRTHTDYGKRLRWILARNGRSAGASRSAAGERATPTAAPRTIRIA